MSDWWTASAGAEHEQGDLSRGFPVVHVESVQVTEATADVRSHVEFVDAIIVTQTGDLDNAKVASILLARVTPWTDFAAA